MKRRTGDGARAQSTEITRMLKSRLLVAESLASVLADLRRGRPPVAEPLASVLADLRRENVDVLNREAMTEVFKRIGQMTRDDWTRLEQMTVGDLIKAAQAHGDDPITVLKRIKAFFGGDLIFKHLPRLVLLDMNEPGTADRRWAHMWDCVDVLLPELVSLAKTRANVSLSAEP